MRVWFVPIEELSDKHVLGQHRELHMMESMLISAHFATHPLVVLFADKIGYLNDYHDRLVKEIYHRFGVTDIHEHKTANRVYGFDNEGWVPPHEWVVYDMYDLKARYEQAPEGKYKWTNRPVPEWVSSNTLPFDLPGITPGYRIKPGRKVGILDDY